MKKTVVLAAVVSSFACLLLAGSQPRVGLNEAEFRDRVYACWLGKNIGGTLGMPFEGKKDVNNLEFYTKLKAGEPAANDDLDLQILWLKAMEEHGAVVDARILGEYWVKYVPVDWNEYGIGKANMKRGLLPPVSGEFDNAKWKHSNGAWIRSEIWACLAPGQPELAVRMAREDACVDHGAGEGTLAELFTAAVESAAFVEHDRDRLIAFGLSMIPQDCGVARAIRAVLAAKQAGKTWHQAREDVLGATADTGWFQAPRNVAFTVIGWVYGDGDFARSICIAVNCGDDTDCTGATLGSIFGIIHGTRGIPAKWKEPIGDGIKTVAVSGFPVPANLQALTDRTVAMTRRVLALNQAPVQLVPGPTRIEGADVLLRPASPSIRELWGLSPWKVTWRDPEFTLLLDYGSEPVMQPGNARALTIRLADCAAGFETASLAMQDVPRDWTVSGLPATKITMGKGKALENSVQIQARQASPGHYAMKLVISGKDRSVAIPVCVVVR